MADNATLGLLTASTVPKEIWRILERWHSQRGITFTQAFPRERVDGPTIVWRIISRAPGKEGIESRKPRLRTAIRNEQQISNFTAQWMTLTYQFDLYDVSNEAVDALAEEWDSVVETTKPFLMEKGVEHFQFSQQLQDDTLHWARNDELYTRSFRYLCILPYYYINTKQAIRDIYLTTYADDAYETVPITRGTGAYDTYPELHVDTIYTVYQHLTGSERKVFTRNIDFKVLTQSDGSCQLYWLQYGAQPSENEVYMVEASRFRTIEITSSLGEPDSPTS